ncbi:hypothetical protein StauST398-1_0014 [Staphylococcus phage StauST398-1]|uniref:Uncharacterized protein n=1 Tax=Staphylococcus phage StauST398-1 TaxID=1195068 RepID=M9NSV0_9CAUD|nr:hypothetical protein StauST398-1_0014 [Staphylococcus phage StauST398-1]AFN39883.1 hypothetical protein StauST398-1_0014 [Staphylococcus phage StauST398-1]
MFTCVTCICILATIPRSSSSLKSDALCWFDAFGTSSFSKLLLYLISPLVKTNFLGSNSSLNLIGTLLSSTSKLLRKPPVLTYPITSFLSFTVIFIISTPQFYLS